MYSVEVTDENDIKRKYKINMTGKDAKENIEIFKPRKIEKIIAYIMIFSILVLSFCIMNYVFNTTNVASDNEVSSDCETDGTVFVDCVGEENQISLLFEDKEFDLKNFKGIKIVSVVFFLQLSDSSLSGYFSFILFGKQK